MYEMRETWTDGRMDDFAKHVNQRFDAVDDRFEAVNRRFDSIDRRFEAVNRRFDGLDARFDALQQTLLRVGAAMVVGLIGVMATLIGVIATQL